MARSRLVPPGLEGRVLAAARRARPAPAAAIARLAAAAEPVLVRSSDPATPARDAALLLAHRDRLRYLDRTIGEIRDHLARNAGNPTARAAAGGLPREDRPAPRGPRLG